MKQATIEFENGEKIVIEMYEEAAPNTVANFEKLATSGFYDGVVFHRVIPGFVAQGGDPTGTGSGGPGYAIACETEGNPHKHKAGSLSMAHAGKDTGGSQFFLVHEPQPHLDGVHTVFGQVIEGMDVVLRIKQGDAMKTVTFAEKE
ncbi:MULTISPECIES: peptidylprolyl isomerase [Paraliobacillus]|uniref:peptidylprolyl isomerase n=1 Tax=Paraliobacillus TaxID=200903 RepID=UPI000DD47C99|nr:MULTISPECIES: peptidylprolyl isomerase [Paraliobacillus]